MVKLLDALSMGARKIYFEIFQDNTSPQLALIQD